MEKQCKTFAMNEEVYAFIKKMPAKRQLRFYRYAMQFGFYLKIKTVHEEDIADIHELIHLIIKSNS